MMKRTLGILVAALLAAGLQGSPASASSPPARPGDWQPSAIAGCWNSILDRDLQRRTYTLSGHRFVELRTVTTFVRWCPSSGYVLVVWRGAWHPPRR